MPQPSPLRIPACLLATCIGLIPSATTRATEPTQTGRRPGDRVLFGRKVYRVGDATHAIERLDRIASGANQLKHTYEGAPNFDLYRHIEGAARRMMRGIRERGAVPLKLAPEQPGWESIAVGVPGESNVSRLLAIQTAYSPEPGPIYRLSTRSDTQAFDYLRRPGREITIQYFLAGRGRNRRLKKRLGAGARPPLPGALVKVRVKVDTREGGSTHTTTEHLGLGSTVPELGFGF